MTSLWIFLFFINAPYPIHDIHEMWVSFILSGYFNGKLAVSKTRRCRFESYSACQRRVDNMLLLKLIGGFFGLMTVIAAVLMIIGIIIQVFRDE